MRGLYEYVNLLKVPSAPSQHVKYMLLVELARIFVEDRTERVIKKLLDYKTIKESSVEIERLVQIAGNYADDFARMDTQSVDAQGSVRDALLSLADSLESDPDSGKMPHTRLQSQLVQNLGMYSYVCIRYC